MKYQDLKILYEDNHLLAYNKPAGLLVQRDKNEAESLEELSKSYIKARYQKPGAVFLGVAHRIDRPVSGLVLLASRSGSRNGLLYARGAGCASTTRGRARNPGKDGGYICISALESGAALLSSLARPPRMFRD